MTIAHRRRPLLPARPLSGSDTPFAEVDFGRTGIIAAHSRTREPTASRRFAWCHHQPTLNVINSGRNTHRALTLRRLSQQQLWAQGAPTPFKPRTSRSSVAYVIRRRVWSMHDPVILSTETLPDIPSASSACASSESSSGYSSPQSSLSPVIFSSSSSTSSRSPAPSDKSSAELSPQPSHSVRRQPRIQVSSLLADPHTRSYHLEVVQHPQKTAEFGTASLSRLPLTPPIVAQLTVRDPSGNPIVPEGELPFLIAHLSLYSDNGLTPLDMGSSIGQSSPILYGNLVSSIDILEDLQGNMGLFFLFPDVSIRYRGRFQLGITLLRLSSINSAGSFSLADHGTVLAEARTNSFDVLAYSQYTAVPETRLTQCFLRQGARLSTFISQPSP